MQRSVPHDRDYIPKDSHYQLIPRHARPDKAPAPQPEQVSRRGLKARRDIRLDDGDAARVSLCRFKLCESLPTGQLGPIAQFLQHRCDSLPLIPLYLYGPLFDSSTRTTRPLYALAQSGHVRRRELQIAYHDHGLSAPPFALSVQIGCLLLRPQTGGFRTTAYRLATTRTAFGTTRIRRVHRSSFMSTHRHSTFFILMDSVLFPCSPPSCYETWICPNSSRVSRAPV